MYQRTKIFKAAPIFKELSNRSLFEPLCKLLCKKLALIFLLSAPSPAAIIYVKPIPQGLADGSNWSNAAELQNALQNIASPGDTVWVMAGVYYPTSDSLNRSATFHLLNNVSIYGGFNGSETLLEQRDWEANLTILSGDIDGDDLGGDIVLDVAKIQGGNSFSVVTGSGTNNTALLDGFVITAGLSDTLLPASANNGAGIYNQSGNPTLSNLTISGNSATNGGGILNDDSSPLLNQVTIVYNLATNGGGGILNQSNSAPVLINVTFEENHADLNGGGMFSRGSSPSLNQVKFINNTAEFGGGMSTNLSLFSNITDTIFEDNSAVIGGGLFCDSSSPNLAGVTFIKNMAETSGGGMFNISSNPILNNVEFQENLVVGIGGEGNGGALTNQTSSPLLTNVSFTNNEAELGGGVANLFSSAPKFNMCTFQENRALNEGGGIYNQGSSPDLSNVAFLLNSAAQGGGIDNTGSTSNPTLVNVTFDRNTVSLNGGGIHNSNGASASLINTTFSANVASFDGGAMRSIDSGLVSIINSIFWGNLSSSITVADRQISNQNSTPEIAYSLIQGGLPTGSIDNGNNVPGSPNPLFVDTLAGDLRLKGSSPALDVGNNTTTPTLPATDLKGSPRIYNSVIDLGAYEFNVLYVDLLATSGSNNGTSWTNAFIHIQSALSAAVLGQEIWVATGIYYPTAVSTDRDASFQLITGVELYGSFSGNEDSTSDRTPQATPTILSGDIDQNDSQVPIISDLSSVTGHTTNSRSVLSAIGVGSSAILDGFVITGGYANSNGGGMLIEDSNPSLTNIIFQGNFAADSGGALYLDNSSPQLTNLQLIDNQATNGGGLSNTNGSDPLINRLLLLGNSATEKGGGIHNIGSWATIANLVANGNTANSGGAISNSNSAPSIVNATLSQNFATSDGGGIFNDLGSGGMISNSIFWNNSAGTGSISEQQLSSPILIPFLSNSIIQGGYPNGAHILNVDPQFVDPDGVDDIFGNLDDDLSLLPSSPAINQGSNMDLPNNISTDYLGSIRIVNGVVDIGAYEARPIFVDRTAILGSQDGSSWDHAFLSLQDALVSVQNQSTNEIWVASGIYKPTINPLERSATFQLLDGVSIYGGFSGNETELSQRDWELNKTILSGDIDSFTNPDITDSDGVVRSASDIQGINSLSVVTASGVDNTAVLDGFIITGGQSNQDLQGSESNLNSGGGIFAITGSPTLLNLTLSGNLAIQGGAIYLRNNSSPSMENLLFFGNDAASGGGVYNTLNSSPDMDRVSFIGNSAIAGGGLYNIFSSDPIVSNAVYSGNSATDSGGAIFNVNSSPSFINLTVSGNSAVQQGGGIYNETSPTSVTNSILWGNTSSATLNSLEQIYSQNGLPIISYSLIQGGVGILLGSIDAGNNVPGNPTAQDVPDPLFLDVDGIDNILGSLDDDLRLLPNSPALNIGNNTVLPVYATSDIRDLPRINQSTVELGAIEYTPPIISIDPIELDVDIDEEVTLSVTGATRQAFYQWYAGESGDTSNPFTTITTSELSTEILPEGHYLFWVSVENENDILYSPTITVTVTATKYGLWNVLNFPDDVGNSATRSTVWGEFADPDEDNLINIYEHLFGFDPNVADSDGTLPLSVEIRPGTDDMLHFNLILHRVENIPDPFIEKIEISSDLIVWEDGILGSDPLNPLHYQQTISIPDPVDGFVTVTFELVSSVMINPRRFINYLLQVDVPEEN
ncbi:MAG: choice-of-anchor Q domain-containing protein [Verrucomicrobiota bacterium]